MNRLKILHVTTVHKRYDTRIFLKQCISLSKNKNYDVNLLVADGIGYELKNSIKIHDIGKPYSRLTRILFFQFYIIIKIIKLKPKIIQFHDPELIFIGYILKIFNYKVLYDSHEDFPLQILGKPYLNRKVAKMLSFVVKFYEKFFLKRFDAIITVTDFISLKLKGINKKTIVVKNYPILNEFSYCNFENKSNEICYVGAISKMRGIYELIKLLPKLNNVKLNLVGDFDSLEFKNMIQSLDGWKYVNYYGFLNRLEISNIFKRSKIGMVTMHPSINYIDALPVKMFEYMIAGLPIICTNIKLWESIVTQNNCGYSVDPFNQNDYLNKINKLINDNEKLSEFSKNGRLAVLEKYNWSLEEKKLLSLYGKL